MRCISKMFLFIIVSQTALPVNEPVNKIVPVVTARKILLNGTKEVWNGTMLLLDTTALVLGRVVAFGSFVWAGYLFKKLNGWEQLSNYAYKLCNGVYGRASWIYQRCLESNEDRTHRVLYDFLGNQVFKKYASWCKCANKRIPPRVCNNSEHINCSCKGYLANTIKPFLMRFYAILPCNYYIFEQWVKLLELNTKDDYLKKVFNKKTIEHVCKIRNDKIWTNYIIPLAQKDQKFKKRCQIIVNENPACRFNWFKRLTVNSLAAINNY